jgi:hypothetical protein
MPKDDCLTGTINNRVARIGPSDAHGDRRLSLARNKMGNLTLATAHPLLLILASERIPLLELEANSVEVSVKILGVFDRNVGQSL